MPDEAASVGGLFLIVLGFPAVEVRAEAELMGEDEQATPE
jgi:hypothetical protein